MTRIQTPSPSPSPSSSPSRQIMEKQNNQNASHTSSRPHIGHQQNNQKLLRESSQKPAKPQGFLDSADSAAFQTRIGINVPLFGLGAVTMANATAQRLGAKVPDSIRKLVPIFPRVHLPARAAELAMRGVNTINSIGKQDAVDATASAVKLGGVTTELVADAGSDLASALKRPLSPFQRGHYLRTNEFQMAPLRSASRPPTPRPPTPRPLDSASSSAAPSTSNQRPSTAPAQSSKPSFVRDAPSRLPMRAKPSSPPRMPAPQLSSPASSTSVAARQTGLVTTLKRISSVANIAGGATDIYFGSKQMIQDREVLGRIQGGLITTAGATSAGSGAAGLAALSGVPGAATASTALATAGLASAAVVYAMAAIPAIHGRDNKNRAIKLYNDASYELQQMDQADKHLSQRANDDLKPTLARLEGRYGIETKTVWLNNNSADFLNQVNSPNNTASGQWKPDADGKVWSNFSDRYIRTGGTPHQDEVVLSLPDEKDGSRPTAAESSITVSGDNTPEKHPATLKSLAAESERYDTQGWLGSTAQPSMSKHYGYQTSSWGQHWETSIPFAVDAGPFYLSHAVSDNGQDTVVLINDTSIERPEKPAPERGYTEGALFSHDGKDGERMTAKQVAALAWEGKPTTIGDKFNVADSAEKAEENAYREAAYPTTDGTSYIRSPDAFARVIRTNPEHRTVVSLQNIARPTRIALQNARDIIDVPNMPRENIRISLSALPSGTVDRRQLSFVDQQETPVLTEQATTVGPDGSSRVHRTTYTLSNGVTLAVEADDLSRIKRFMDAASSRRRPRD